MKTAKFLIIFLAVSGLIISCKAKDTEPQKEAGMPGYSEVSADIARGKLLFNDPALGESTNAASCNTCHPNGKGLEMSGEKNMFNLMGKKQNSLEEAVNFCIENPLEGKAIDPNGKDMKDIIAYIKSLKK